jgi:hypothetical protein
MARQCKNGTPDFDVGSGALVRFKNAKRAKTAKVSVALRTLRPLRSLVCMSYRQGISRSIQLIRVRSL